MHDSVKESHSIQEIGPEGVVGVVKGVLAKKYVCKKENVSLAKKYMHQKEEPNLCDVCVGPLQTGSHSLGWFVGVLVRYLQKFLRFLL